MTPGIEPLFKKIMKLRNTICALCACSISFLPAQTATPETPADEKAEKEVKPEGPYEKRAFKIVDLISTFPDVLTSIKDGATADAAKTKLDALATKLEAQATELKKLAVPSNEDRKKLKTKLEGKQKAMEQKMGGIMAAMQGLDQETSMKIGEIIMEFGPKMQTFGPTMEKYFEPDVEKEKEDE